MGILIRLLAALLIPSLAFAFTLVSDNGTNHRYYDIIGSPYGKVRVESAGSRKGVRYQYRVVIDDNESTPNTFKWAMRRYSLPATEYGDNTTGVSLSDSGNATLNNGDVYFDLGNATGYALGYSVEYLSDNATGYLSIPFNLAPVGTRTLKIRAVGDETYSAWISFTYSRASFDGNFTHDSGNAPATVDEATAAQKWGLTLGSH